jgi:aspartate/methionine/tyrosine aminotransferase
MVKLSMMVWLVLSTRLSSIPAFTYKLMLPSRLRHHHIIAMSSTLNNDASSSDVIRFPTSLRNINTLDPCVILMKQIISQHASKWENDPDGIYSLAQGVVYWRPPPSMYRALADAANCNLDSDSISTGFGMDGAIGNDGRVIHTYCPDEGYPPLIEALKLKLQKENGLQNPHVMVTSGANQAFINCVLTLLDEKDEEGNVSKCVVFKPYYFNHVMAVQMTRGGKTSDDDTSLDLSSEEGLMVGPTKDGVPDLQWLRSKLEQNRYSGGGNSIRMIALVNPGNPTGVALPYDFLNEIKDLTKEFGVWLIMDNTYEHFDISKRNSIPNSTMHDIPDYPCFDEEHVINIFSFSKGYSMAGFRVGYIALSSKSSHGNGKGRGSIAYEEMLKVQDTIAICTSRISQMAALGALEAGRSWVHEQVATLDVGRELILDAMRCSMETIIGGDGAMYVMGKLPDGTDDKEFASKLIELYGVAVIPGSFCGYPGWLRVCYSNLPPEQCKVAALRLKIGLATLFNSIQSSV